MITPLTRRDHNGGRRSQKGTSRSAELGRSRIVGPFGSECGLRGRMFCWRESGLSRCATLARRYGRPVSAFLQVRDRSSSHVTSSASAGVLKAQIAEELVGLADRFMVGGIAVLGTHGQFFRAHHSVNNVLICVYNECRKM